MKKEINFEDCKICLKASETGHEIEVLRRKFDSEEMTKH